MRHRTSKTGDLDQRHVVRRTDPECTVDDLRAVVQVLAEAKPRGWPARRRGRVSRSAERSAGCAQLLVTVLIAIEESGNFGFPEDGRFESYILIAVIAPDSAMPDVRKAAAALRRRMRARELKANKLGGRRLPRSLTPSASCPCRPWRTPSTAG
jgi:hypothetical protein